MGTKIHIFIGFLLFFHQNILGQDIVLNHPYAALMYNNPAYTGIFGPLHAGTAFRSQFTASPAPYTTYYTETDIFVEKWSSGFGFYLLRDLMDAGRLRQTAAALSYVFSLQITDNLALRPAIQGVFHNRHSDFRTVAFPDMFNLAGLSVPSASSTYEPYHSSAFDFSTGLLGQYQRLELGLAVHHLGVQPEDPHLRRSLKMVLHIKCIIPLTGPASGEEVKPSEFLEFERTKLIPTLQYHQQEQYKFMTAGMLVQSGAFYAGAGIKTALQQDVANISLSAGFLSSSFRMGYTTDFTGWGSALSGWQGVSHELFVHFTFGNNNIGAAPRRQNRTKYNSKSCFGCYL
ncbi:MAG: type IX secretion system membrane protein PorP/SprF [Prevotellaceae bacterium]|jgi:type IX secretion system PorP/SprF family membrane protein|nr:type IX secretion system membrane protein PorP/SprF [Prevotellaceae bacterium]